MRVLYAGESVTRVVILHLLVGVPEGMRGYYNCTFYTHVRTHNLLHVLVLRTTKTRDFFIM